MAPPLLAYSSSSLLGAVGWRRGDCDPRGAWQRGCDTHGFSPGHGRAGGYNPTASLSSMVTGQAVGCDPEDV